MFQGVPRERPFVPEGWDRRIRRSLDVAQTGKMSCPVAFLRSPGSWTFSGWACRQTRRASRSRSRHQLAYYSTTSLGLAIAS
jgi:hypothetical protein